MRTSFPPYWPLYKSSEGDKLDTDPRDPGNWTSGKIGVGRLVGSRYGISSAYEPVEDIPNMTEARAMEIVLAKYSPMIHFDEQPAGLDITALDECVNAGQAQAIRDEQRAVGADIDGKWGPQTKMDILAADVLQAIKRYADFRLSFYRGLKSFVTYGVGWSTRVANVEALSCTLAMQAVAQPPEVIADHHEAQATHHEEAAQTATTGAVGSATAGTAGSAASNQVSPEQYVSLPPKVILIVIAIAGLVAVVYFLWRRNAAKARATAFTDAAKGLGI